MYKITVDGKKQYYLPQGAELPKTIVEGDKKWDILIPNDMAIYIKSKLGDANDFRPIITIPFDEDNTLGLGVEFRFWLKTPPNLEELDQKLAKVSEYEDVSQYFRDTVITYYALILCRFGCQGWWHTLTCSSYQYSSKMSYETFQPFILNCPQCEERFSTHVVKIFEKSEPPWYAHLEDEEE